MVKVTGVPLQPAFLVSIGVTVMVATMGVVPGLVAVNAGMFPNPVAGKPMAGLSFVHGKTPPVPVKLTAVVEPPPFTVWLATGFTVGSGFTVPATATF